MITENGIIEDTENFGIEELNLAFEETKGEPEKLETLLIDVATMHLQKMNDEVRIFMAEFDNGTIEALVQAFSYSHGLSIRDAFFFLAGLHSMQKYSLKNEI